MRKITLLGLVFFLLLLGTGGFAFGRGMEEIAVAAKGNNPGALVSERAGTSPFFLLFDDRGDLWKPSKIPTKARVVLK